MTLYHGTNLDIQSIDLALCRPYKDFGKGFYTTELLDQAQKMANRVARIYGGTPVVNVYETPDDLLKRTELNIKDFGNIPSENWALFVMNNRNRDCTDYGMANCNLDCKYDIVSGPIADDDMTILFRQYQNSMISLDMLLNGIIYKKTTSQYSFHTERAVKFLKKVGVYLDKAGSAG